MQRTDSFEKTLILGKIEGGRRRGWQRMRRLDAITKLMDMSLSKLQSWWWDREAWPAAVYGVAELDTTEWMNWSSIKPSIELLLSTIIVFSLHIPCNAMLFQFSCWNYPSCHWFPKNTYVILKSMYYISNNCNLVDLFFVSLSLSLPLVIWSPGIPAISDGLLEIIYEKYCDTLRLLLPVPWSRVFPIALEGGTSLLG